MENTETESQESQTFEEQLNLFGESVLQLHDKIYELVCLMNRQVEENTKLAESVQKLSIDVQVLMNDKYMNDSTKYQLQNRIDMLENDSYLKTPYGSRSHEKVSDVVSQMKANTERMFNDSMMTSLIAMVEIFRLHLAQLPDRDKAEIMSIMSSNQGQVPFAQQNGLPYYHMKLLQIAADMLNQPESIITLYR